MGRGKAATKTRRRRVVELLTLPSVEMATSVETARRRRARATMGAEKEQGYGGGLHGLFASAFIAFSQF